MGRPSLATQRIAQILDAFESCVVEQGYENSSLEKIAERAGMRLSMIRHYIGNRDDLTQAMVARFSSRYQQGYERFSNAFPNAQAVPLFLEYLFQEEDETRQHEEAIFSELISVAERNPVVKEHVVCVYRSVETLFIHLLKESYPGHTRRQYQEVAYSVLCMAEANGTRQWLGFPSRLRKSIQAAAMEVINSHLQ